MPELLVPNRVDAILLTKPRQVTGPHADFEILPWFDTRRDHSSTVPFLASSINAEPFADHSYRLDPGVHLHWTLPDGLTRGSTHRSADAPIAVGDLWFPAVPNRWLIRRRAAEGDWTADRVWLVESDFVHSRTDPDTGAMTPRTTRPDARPIAYPRVSSDPGAPPWLFIGRQIELEPKTLKPADRTTQPFYDNNKLTNYAAPLTALGYGEPTFAAHYPSCRSVFGLHDDKPAQTPDGTVLNRFYDVFGWYDDPEHDPLTAMRDGLDEETMRVLLAGAPEASMSQPLFDTPDGPLTAQMRLDAQTLALRKRFGWTTFTNPEEEFPSRTLVHSRTWLWADETADREPEAISDADIGIGASPAEAFAASLIGKKGDDHVVTSAQEDQLVQSLAASDLAHHALDLGPKLREARHDEQFRALPGHRIWALRPRDGEANSDGLTLPDDLAHTLNDLNRLQQAYDRATDQIDGLRQELYSDWVHYMRAAYPEGDRDPFRVDLNDLQDLIERTRLTALEEELRKTGHLSFGSDDLGNQVVTDRLALPGPATGTASGAAFSVTLEPREHLRGIDVHVSDHVDALHLLGSNGLQGTPMAGASTTTTRIRLLPSESVCTVSGGWLGTGEATRLVGLRLDTSFGRHFGPFGAETTGADLFEWTAPRGLQLCGLHGSSDGQLTSLGPYFSDPSACAETDISRAGPPTLATLVVAQHARLLKLLEQHGVNDLTLGLSPGARYFRPNDPIIALNDTSTRASERHGHDGMNSEDGHSDADRKRSRQFLETFVFSLPGGWENPEDRTQFPQGLAEVALMNAGHLEHLTRSRGLNWHALFAEWQAEIRPLREGSNHDTDQYEKGFVAQTQDLPDARPDYTARPAALAPGYEYLSGRSVLNPSAGGLLARRFAALPDELRHGLKVPEQAPIVLPLGGFHDQLLMRRHELQLPINDPVGLSVQRRLAERMRDALGAFHPLTPLPDSPFHPIRSGELLVQRLRVVDTFGRSLEWRPATLHTTARMRPPSGGDDRAALPLRLSQPARLDLRWLAAEDDAVEANSHPATTPVCGFVVANELDREVVIYANDGRLLGSVDTDGGWRPAPGDPAAPRSHRDITNRHLARFAQWLILGDDPALLVDAFLDTVEDTLDRIDPAHGATHQARAMLISRPLALVRAQIDLTPQHHVAQDQSWRALRARLQGAPPSTHAVGDVRFGVRLGEIDQLNDGLCGYWLDGPLQSAKAPFFTPMPHIGTAHEKIRALMGTGIGDLPVQASLSGAPNRITMLMDPMGVVHATSGVLPTKAIGLPLDQVRPQLDSLRATFATAPILTSPQALEIPLPSAPGFSCVWLENDGRDWHETPHHPTIRYVDFVAGFGPVGPRLWERLTVLGRLVHTDHSEAAQLQQATPDADPGRFEDLGLSVETVERGLHSLAHGVEPISLEARLTTRIEARDGWLQLRKSPPAASPLPSETES